MDAGRIAVVGVATALVLVTVATGPLVAAVEVPRQGFDGHADLGEGNATIDAIDAPSEARFATGQYEDLRYLTVPDATLDVANVDGAPLLVYSIDIQELGYSSSSVYVLTDRSEGSYTVGMDRKDFERSRLDRSQYEGTLRILLRSNGSERVVYDDQITVVVEE